MATVYGTIGLGDEDLAELQVSLLQTGAIPQAARGDVITERLDELMADGTDLTVLPEFVNFSNPALPWRQMLELAEPVRGPLVKRWEGVARRHGSYVVAGIVEVDGPRLYDSSVLVGPDGVLGVYRKLHLFEREKLVFSPGNLGLPVFDLPFGRIAMGICYDLRFVEVLRALALKGAVLVAVPAAWVGGFDVSPERELLPQALGAAVQANLSQVFVAAAGRSGVEEGVEYLGSSFVAGPNGQFCAGPLSMEENETLSLALDLGDAFRSRVRAPLITPQSDRRRDVYRLRVHGEEL